MSLHNSFSTMPRILQLIRNRSRNKDKDVVIIPPSPSAESSGVQQVVEDLTALSSTSQSSPSNNSSTSSVFGRKKKHFRKGSSQIFRRGASSKSQGKKSSTSVFPSLEEVSQVSSLSSPFDSERVGTKYDQRIELLAPTLKLKKGSSKITIKKSPKVTGAEALAKAKKDLAAKEAKIQYLDTLVKELKSLYTNKLEMKDMELAALRKELKAANEELSDTKENLADVMDGQSKLIEDVSKKAKEPNCWYPVLGSIQFN